MQPVRKSILNDVIQRSNYTPLINNLLLTNPLHIDVIIRDSRAIIATNESVELVAAATKRIEQCYFIYDKLLAMTVEELENPTDTAPSAPAVQTEQKEAKVIAMPKPVIEKKTLSPKSYDVVEIPAQLTTDLSEEVRFCNNLTDLEAILRNSLKDADINALYAYYANFINTMDVSKMFIGKNETPDEQKATVNLQKSLARLKSNQGAQTSRFYAQVENWHTRQPKTCVFKKIINRLPMSEVIEVTKRLHTEGKTEGAWQYAENNLRKICVMSDKDSTKVIPAMSKEAFEKWFKQIAPDYVHVIIPKETKPATTTTESTTEQVTEPAKEESPFVAARTYDEVLEDVNILISNNNIDDAKALAQNHLVHKGFIEKIESTDVIQWSDQTFQMFWDMYLESKTNPVEVTPEVIKEAETVLVEELVKNKEGDNVPQLGLFNTILDKLNYSFSSEVRVNLFKRVKDMVSKITTSAPVEVPETIDVNATIFIRTPLLESNPKEWETVKSITKLTDLYKFCKKANEGKLGFSVALNAAHDVITSGNIADAKEWPAEQIDKWFNETILPKNNTVAEEPVVKATVEPKKEDVSTEQESSTSQTVSEPSTGGENSNVETPVIKDRKKLLEHCVNMLVMGEDEREVIEVVLAHSAHHRFDDAWADSYMQVIRKNAKKRMNKAKQQ